MSVSVCVLIPFRLRASETNKKTNPTKKKTSYSNKATRYALPQLVKNLTNKLYVVGPPYGRWDSEMGPTQPVVYILVYFNLLKKKKKSKDPHQTSSQ